MKADLERMGAVVGRPIPANPRVAAFSGFCQLLVQGYSEIVSPLTERTSVNVRFNWLPEADTAFEGLKKLFSMALILIQPDPSKQFEGDASDVRAVLSHYSVPDNQLIHVSFTLIGSHLQSRMMM